MDADPLAEFRETLGGMVCYLDTGDWNTHDEGARGVRFFLKEYYKLLYERHKKT